MKMLDFDVIPERSISNPNIEFILGMPLQQAIYQIQKNCNDISDVQIIYNDDRPLDSDIIICLSKDGVKLVFDKFLQRLKLIEIYDLSKLKLRYGGNYFSSPTVPATFEQIDSSFGATHPGVYDKERQLFVLNFRGLSFFFHVSTDAEPKSLPAMNALHFPTSPVLSKLLIYSGISLSRAETSSIPAVCFEENYFLDSAQVIREQSKTKGIALRIQYSSMETSSSSPSSYRSNRPYEDKRFSEEKKIFFGDTCQDVESTLGSPMKIYYKSDDRMKIHSTSEEKYNPSNQSDYFFNYITLGLDILFDAVTNTVKKLILHTNYPGHYNFNSYYRCHFEIPLLRADPINTGEFERLLITPFSKWEEVQDFLEQPVDRPAVLNRCSSTNTTNPFGATFCYGVEDMICEVMQNGHIACVMLYNSEPASAS